jgi:hypothetical protein
MLVGVAGWILLLCCNVDFLCPFQDLAKQRVATICEQAFGAATAV